MSKIHRREMVKVSALLTLGTPISLLVNNDIGSGPLSVEGGRYPRVVRQDFAETCIDLGASTPTSSVTERFEKLLIEAVRSHRISVVAEGRITPCGDFDDRYIPWIELCERYGVNEIVERSNREPAVSAPHRVGQIDPAGIVYRITS